MAEQPDKPDPTPEQPERPSRALFVLLFMLGLVLLLGMASQDGVGGAAGQKPLDLVEFERLLVKNEVERVHFVGLDAKVTLRPGNLEADDQVLVRALHLSGTEAVDHWGQRIVELSQPSQVNPIDTEFIQDPSNDFLWQFLSWFLPMLFFVGIIYFLMFRQMRGPGSPGSLMNFGKSPARESKSETKVTLDDVAGIDEARQDIEEIIAFLKNPQKFSRLGGRIPKGVLLIGPPGTGKTLLARATAGEAGVPFYSVSGSDFVEMFVGVGASRVRDLFDKAKKNSPCIIFLDEVDAVGRRRGAGLGGGHDEREQTLNQILVEMDGFETDRGIIIMAATNRADILDPALLRPGRFDRQIVVQLPNVVGREKILRVHAKRKKMAVDVDYRRLARATATFSGAELEAILNEAALMAAMADRNAISMHDLEEARDRIRWGRQRKSQRLVEEELRTTAWHEAGHALVAELVEGCDPVHKVTIVPRGRALGLTMALPDKDVLNLNRKQILARIAMAYGGRIGEEHYTGEFSTGAANDLEQASAMARRMVTEWGMSETLGQLKYGSPPDGDAPFLGRDINRQQTVSEATLQQIDAEVRRITDEQYALATRLIEENKDALRRIAEGLLRYETIDGKEVRGLIEGREIERPVPAPPAPKPIPAEIPGDAQAAAVSDDPDAAPATADEAAESPAPDDGSHDTSPAGAAVNSRDGDAQPRGESPTPGEDPA